ncbi:MAG: hypothetical protein M4579_001538 [Chaenotheca gracillima]|nr:MAG: hypothetical protein M4579_001538 [Chaenotheca gracillima]
MGSVPVEPDVSPPGAIDTASLVDGDGISSSPTQFSSSQSSAHDNPPDSSKRIRLKQFSRRAKEKTKKLLPTHDAPKKHQIGNNVDGDAIERIDANPAFNPRKLPSKKVRTGNGPIEETVDLLASVGASILKPREAIKKKATRATADRISKVGHPYLSHKADIQFLQANDVLPSSDSSRASSTSDTVPLTPYSQVEVDRLEEHRESMRVAWTTSRHVSRARVVPKRHLKFPERAAFREFDKDGNFVRFQWEMWLGYAVVYYTQDFCVQYIDDFDKLPFDVDVLRYHVERLVMASAPWQAWVLHVRRVYRWEDTMETGRWFAFYLVLWYTQHIMGFLESMKRSLDRRLQAYHFGELIDKHGRGDWIGPLVDELGPYLQLQLGDLANLLEVLSNFYSWKSPKKTAASLFFFFSCLVVSLVADMEFCMKIVWFIVGGSFFLCWPIASLYPKHRYLVSPIKWVLWGIPTYAEWSFEYLRKNAQISREKMIGEKVEEHVEHDTANPGLTAYAGTLHAPHIVTSNSDGVDGDIQLQASSDSSLDSESSGDYFSIESSHSILDETDLMSFRGEWNGRPGRLIVYSSGVRFVSRIPTKKECWRRGFMELREMRKRVGHAVPKALDLDQQIVLEFTDGEVVQIKALRNRDEAFNTVIGFSGLQWQCLQTGSQKTD